MNLPDKKVLTILGGGFSGVSTLLHLLPKLKSPVQIFFVEKKTLIARGLAYGTTESEHLLNVPAARMGVYQNDPLDFLKWLKENKFDYVGTDFVPRKIYGDYLESRFEKALSAYSHIHVERIQDEVTNLRKKGAKTHSLTLKSGQNIETDFTVLALGHGLAPSFSKIRGDLVIPHWYQEPWGYFQEIAKNPSVLILGTGLTMVDTVMSLVHHNPQIQITALSRHGLLPQPHVRAEVVHESFSKEILSLRSIKDLVRVTRAAAKRDKISWQNHMDEVRKVAQSVWHQLPIQDKKRFFRHVRSYWEIHRHRIAPQVHKRITDLMDKKQLKVLAGSLVSLKKDQKLNLEFRSRHDGALKSLSTNAVINCAGSDFDLLMSGNTLVKNLLKDKTIIQDELKTGLKTTAEGQVLDHEGKIQERLFVMGPSLRAYYWEITAVPELRAQAERLAQSISEEIRMSREEESETCSHS